MTRTEKINLASSDTTSTEVLEELSKEPDRIVRTYVAWNPNTSIETLRTLATDNDFSVRANVSLNPNTPVDVIQTLEKDSHPIVSQFLKDPERQEMMRKLNS